MQHRRWGSRQCQHGAGELGNGNEEGNSIEVVVGAEGHDTSNVEDGVGILLGLEEGEHRSCLLLEGERSGGRWRWKVREAEVRDEGFGEDKREEERKKEK